MCVALTKRNENTYYMQFILSRKPRKTIIFFFCVKINFVTYKTNIKKIYINEMLPLYRQEGRAKFFGQWLYIFSFHVKVGFLRASIGKSTYARPLRHLSLLTYSYIQCSRFEDKKENAFKLFFLWLFYFFV